MKVIAAVILIIGSASSLGSGPYLPSGWRPDGPAFVLPARPPVAIPLQDFTLQGSDASGSDFLREYGPPKVQGLPDEATEKSFVFLPAFAEVKSEDTEVVEAATEVITDLKYVAEEDTSSATESAVVEVATEVQEQKEQFTFEGRSNLEVEASIAEETESNQELEAEVQQTNSHEESTEVKTTETSEIKAELVQEVKAVEVEVETVETEVKSVEEEMKSVEEEVKIVEEEVKTVAEEVKTAEEGVKNIAEAIISLEKQEEQFSQELIQLKSVEQTSGLEKVPEGFLEYGPPGFREYGPPDQITLPRTADDVKSEDEKIENNETRRRRFSPKFKSSKAKKH